MLSFTLKKYAPNLGRFQQNYPQIVCLELYLIPCSGSSPRSLRLFNEDWKCWSVEAFVPLYSETLDMILSDCAADLIRVVDLTDRPKVHLNEILEVWNYLDSLSALVNYSSYLFLGAR